MNRCKHCVGSKCVKNGFANEKQRYKCKDCGKSYRDGDLREKYSIERKLSVISMYWTELQKQEWKLSNTDKIKTNKQELQMNQNTRKRYNEEFKVEAAKLGNGKRI